MQKIAEFINHANECLTLAAGASDEKMRDQLTDLAQKWMDLAAEREKFLKSADATRPN
jgi:hypothetical protein